MLVPVVDGGFSGPDGFGHWQRWISCSARDAGQSGAQNGSITTIVPEHWRARRRSDEDARENRRLREHDCRNRLPARPIVNCGRKKFSGRIAPEAWLQVGGPA